MNFLKELYQYILWRYRKWRENQYDRKHNIDTSYENKDFFSDTMSANKAFAVAYEPIHQHVMQEMLSILPRDLSNTKFIDFGSGKGRALFMASELNFEEIIGVELSVELCQIAERNITNFTDATHRRNVFKIHNQDVGDYELPGSDLVIFLYNPFFGDVMKKFIKKLEFFINSTSYHVHILYRNPQCSELFKNSLSLQLSVANSAYHVFVSKRP